MVAQERAPGLRWRAAWSSPAVASDRAVADSNAELEQLTSDALGTPQLVLARHGDDQLSDFGTEVRPATTRAGLPAPEEAPTLPMPTHDRVWCHYRQVLAPAGTPAASQDPEQLVPDTKASTCSGADGTGEDGKLVAQQQVLEHEVVARVRPGQDRREQQPDEFEPVFSIADLWRAVLPPHNL
jgi:hypothetical protein